MRTLWQRPEPSAGPPSNPAEIADRALHRRAIEAVIWGMPAVNFELMRRQMVKLGGSANQVVFWSRPVNWVENPAAGSTRIETRAAAAVVSPTISRRGSAEGSHTLARPRSGFV